MRVELSMGVLAAALSTAATAADPMMGSVYGDFRMSLTHFDRSGSPSRDEDLGDNGSHFGFKASVAKGDYRGFGKYERHLDTDDSVNAVTGVGTSTTSLATGGSDYVREALVGVTCPRLGTMIYGQAETAYSQAARAGDPFYATGLADIAGASSGGFIGTGPSHGGSVFSVPILGLAYVNNTLAYISPSFFGGLTVNGALYTDEDAGGEQDHDLALGAEFKMGALSLGAQVLDTNSGTSPGSTAPNFALNGIQAVLLHAGLSNKAWGASVTAERLDGPGITVPSADSVRVSGWFGVSDTVRLAASVGSTNNVAEGTSVAVGVFRDVVENLTTYAGGRVYDGSARNQDAYALALGLSYKFELGFAK